VENQYIFGNSKRINRHVEENQSNSFNHSCSLITLYFLDFGGILPQQMSFMADIQFIPALLALNIAIVGALVGLTLFIWTYFIVRPSVRWVFIRIRCVVIKKTHTKKNVNSYSKAKTILRWSILGAVIVSFVFGFTFLLGLLDPYGAYGRIVTHLFRPAYLAGNNLLAEIFRNSRTIHLQISIYGLGIFQPSSPC